MDAYGMEVFAAAHMQDALHEAEGRRLSRISASERRQIGAPPVFRRIESHRVTQLLAATFAAAAVLAATALEVLAGWRRGG